MTYFYIIIQLYVLYSICYYLIFYDRIRFFLKFEISHELQLFKQEFNIKNKFFDVLTVFIFLLVLPIYKPGKEC